MRVEGEGGGEREVEPWGGEDEDLVRGSGLGETEDKVGSEVKSECWDEVAA